MSLAIKYNLKVLRDKMDKRRLELIELRRQRTGVDFVARADRSVWSAQLNLAEQVIADLDKILAGGNIK